LKKLTVHLNDGIGDFDFLETHGGGGGGGGDRKRYGEREVR